MRDYHLEMDVQVEENITRDIWFVSGDIGNIIYFKLSDDNIAINLTGISVLAFFVGKDGIVHQKTLIVTEPSEGLCYVEVTNAITQLVGTISVELKLYEGSNRTSFTPFSIISKKSINTDDAVESLQEIDVVQIMMENNQKIIALTKNLDECIELVEKKIVDLDTDVVSNIQELHKEVNKNIINLNKVVNDNIKLLAENVENNIYDLTTSVEATIVNVNEVLKNTVADVNNNMEILDNAKLDVIYSETQPDIVGLRVGTVWIRPKLE